MNEVRPLVPYRAKDGRRHPRVRIEGTAHTPVRHPLLVKGGVVTRGIASWNVQSQEACLDAPFAQCRQERQQVALRPTDTVDLVDVKDLHGRVNNLAYRRSIASAMRTVVNRSRISAAPRRPIASAAAGSPARAARYPARADVSPIGAR